jgi:hypothetical protein
MLLNESQIIKLIRSNDNQIGQMIAYESRLKVMSEPLFFTELESETG